jgi:hypothetical protein
MISHFSRPGYAIHRTSFLVFLITAGLCGLAGAAQVTEVIHEGGFSAAQLTWDQDGSGQMIPVLPRTQRLSQPGLPDLPVRDLLLLVPSDWKVTDVRVEPLASHQEKVPGSLAMAAPLAASTGEFIATPRMARMAGAFPEAWGEFKGAHAWRGYQMIAVGVHPMRETDEGLDFLDSFAIVVTREDAAGSPAILQRERFVPGEKAANQAVLSRLVENPEKVVSYSRPAGQVVAKSEGGFQPTRTPSLSGSPVHFVIITNEAMAPEFQRLADHKTAQGIHTLVTTREFIAANFRNGSDIQETMRMFLQDAYAKWGTEYVLLGGDSDILPPRMITNSFYPATGETDIPVDLYFAGLDGNWNADGNAFYGEPGVSLMTGDQADFAEELYIGRAPVSTPEAAQVFVDKTIGYETTPAESLWPSRVLYASEVLFPSEYIPGGLITLDGAQFSDQMVNDLVEPCTDMSKTRMYETDALFPMDAPLTKDALVDSLNTGHYGIFNQIGHGYYFNMSVGDGNFRTSDADNLTNTDRPFVLFSLNCASCAFDYSCLMERFMQNANGGSVISIGSARAAFPNTSNNYQQEFFRLLYCEEENRVGRLVALSRLPFLANTIYNYVDRWTFENYTLLGDPTLSLWTSKPQAADVFHSSLQLGPNSFVVSVSQGVMPVRDAIISLSRAGEDLAVGVTDINGQATLDYLVAGEGEVTLTVTGRNLALQTRAVPVSNGQTFLVASDMIVQDDGGFGSSGNGNGVMEAGEVVALWPVLQETAGAGTSGIDAVFSCDDPLVEIVDGEMDFAPVGGGETTQGSQPLIVLLDSDLPDGHPVTFDASTTHTAGGPNISRWESVVKAPENEVVSLTWEDETYGNGDGVLDSGERVVLSVAVKNFGAGTGSPLSAVLRTDNPNVAVFDSLSSFGALELMETGMSAIPFSLMLNDNTRKSESRIVLEDTYGRTIVHQFYLQRPAAPEIIETDTSLGADVIVLRWSPSSSPDVRGYHVYRSPVESGPFLQVNTDLVQGVSYYRDEGLNLLTRYFYRIASVDSTLVASAPSFMVTQSTAPAENGGFPVPFLNETSGHLAVGDVDGDGDEEIVLASDEVYVWHHDGSELLDGDGDSQTLGQFTDLSTILEPSGVALAQLDAQPGMEMVVSERGNTDAIHVFGKDGNELPGWPQTLSGLPGTDWNWATPAVGDVDGDGEPEIVVLTVNGALWVWHADGTELRDGDNNPATNGVFLIREGASSEWSHCSPVLYDLDGDGARDIIFGTKTDSSGLKRLMALRYDGTDVSGFPYITQGAVDSSPALGDLNNDGIMEIVFYDWSQRVYAVQQDGTDYPGFPVYYGVGSAMSPAPSVALGDMDDDGELEIVFAVNVTGLDSRLLVFDTDVTGGTSGDLLNGWPKVLPGSSEGSPVLGDIDGDSMPDILYGIGGGNEDAPDNLYAFHADGQPIDGFPITLTGPAMPSPVICDLDHDMDVDIVYGGWDRVVHVWDMPFAYDRRNVPWPTFQGNMRRDGVFFPIGLVPVDDTPDLVPSAFQVGKPYPNPFNPSTSVRLYVPGEQGAGQLELAVYDLQGRKVRLLHQGAIAPGWHTLVWDGRNDRGEGQSSGLYFLRARSAQSTAIHKMTLVK